MKRKILGGLAVLLSVALLIGYILEIGFFRSILGVTSGGVTIWGWNPIGVFTIYIILLLLGISQIVDD